MARAAAKRTPRPKPEHHGRARRPSGGGGVEQTLFFQRIRRQAKWVFVLLAFLFAGSFVIYGVGSGSTGIGDLLRGNFSGIFGGGSSSGNPSISKAQKEIAKNPKSAQPYLDLARAYEQKNQHAEAISALESYVKLRPKNIEGQRELAAEYGNLAQSQLDNVRAVAFDAQASQGSTFGPAPNTPLGKAFGATPNPIDAAVTQAANVRYNDAISQLQSTYSASEQVFARIVKLDPTDSQTLLAYAGSAQQASDPTTALTAYKKFLKLFPDDPSAPYAKQQLKTLNSQVAPSSHG
jgi:Tfp pilus assembly protein PilF